MPVEEPLDDQELYFGDECVENEHFLVKAVPIITNDEWIENLLKSMDL